MNSDRSREILETALRVGGDVLLEHFGKKGKVVIKESISSVVTEADLASEKAIIEILDRAPVQYNIISEELGYMDRESSYTWVVDPLDGTSNFAAGLPWFGVIIALFRESEPVQGGMYLPMEHQIYFAERGKGAWKNGEPVKTTDSGKLADHLISYSFDFSNNPGKTSQEMELLKRLSSRVRNIRSTNSLIDFCYTVDGRLGGAINQTTKIWDIAATWLLIKEAGGKVTDISGKEIKFDLSARSVNHNYTIVVSGNELYNQLFNIITETKRI